MSELKIIKSSTPTVFEFNPRKVPYQIKTLTWLRSPKYKIEGVKRCLLSGSVGSAKSILAAHIISTHVRNNPGAGVLILRRTLKDLKRTIWRVLLKHDPFLKAYWNKSEMTITLPNGSIIYGDSYAEGDYEKFNSYELSMVDLEEAVEADEKELFDNLMERLGRLPHVDENIFLMQTNPGPPEHWIHKEIIEKEDELTKVFYSLTEENPFLPKWYIENLKKTLDPKRAQRMLYGKWVAINEEIIYHAYDSKLNRIALTEIDKRYPLDFMWDFNVGLGKPMSMAIGQRIDGEFLIFDEVILDGGNTPEVMDELANRGYFDDYDFIRIFGDCNGYNKDSRSSNSDYSIIKKFIENYVRPGKSPVRVEIYIPSTNPIVRTRHNTVNAEFCNANGTRSVFVSSKCKTVDEGFRLTSLKKGGNYVEDDSKRFQHVTTAIGYWICQILRMERINAPIQRRRA